MIRGLSAATIAMLLFTHTALAQGEWADITVKFVLDGEAPLLSDIPANFFTRRKIANERLLVNKNNMGIANMVFMIDARFTKLSQDQIHPSLREVPATHALLNIVDCRFVPHVFHVRAGQTVEVANDDPMGHSVKFVFFNNNPWNRLLNAGETKALTIHQEESGPFKVEGNIHPWMNAYPVVTDHPYVGISDDNGLVKIDKLPAGTKLTFKMWHESQNKFGEVTVNGKSDRWKRGTVELTLKAGANDLGTVALKPSKFKP